MTRRHTAMRSNLAGCWLRALLAAVSLMFPGEALCQEGSALPTILPSPNASPSAALSRDPEYMIAADDVLDVYVLDVPELSRQYTVGAAGAVAIPLLTTPQPAAGLTLIAFSRKLEDKLKEEGIVSNPHVITSVHESRLHAVAVVGAVEKPQLYQVLGRTTLLDVLSQAGGTTAAAGNTATITRGDLALATLSLADPTLAPSDLQARRTLRVDLEGLLQRGDPDLNVAVYPGDRVTVALAGVVYVVGSVNRPGGFPLTQSKQRMTVLEAVALAEDLKATAVRDKAIIIHNDTREPTGHTQIPVNLKKLLAGKSPDMVLEAQDILFIPDSTGRRALRRAAEAAVQVAAGVAIYRR